MRTAPSASSKTEFLVCGLGGEAHELPPLKESLFNSEVFWTPGGLVSVNAKRGEKTLCGGYDPVKRAIVWTKEDATLYSFRNSNMALDSKLIGMQSRKDNSIGTLGETGKITPVTALLPKAAFHLEVKAWLRPKMEDKKATSGFQNTNDLVLVDCVTGAVDGAMKLKFGPGSFHPIPRGRMLMIQSSGQPQLAVAMARRRPFIRSGRLRMDPKTTCRVHYFRQ